MELERLWGHFWRLRRRASNVMGRQPIGWEDFTHFQMNARVRLGPWEIDLIEMLDDLYLAAKPEESPNEE